MDTVKIIGTGTYLPGEPIPFDDIQARLGILPRAPKRVAQWVKEMTPVMKDMLEMQNYYYAFDPESRVFTEDNVTMAVKAAQTALAAAGLTAQDVDLICYGSAQQNFMPPATVRIQEALGIDSCAEFSVYSNCTSAYKALFIAKEMISAGHHKTALVVSSNLVSSSMMSEYYNQEKLTRETVFMRWFLCDGAAALILTSEATHQPSLEVRGNYLESIGKGRDPIMYDGRTARPMNPLEEYENARHHVSQSFRNALNSGTFQEASTGKSIIYSGLKRMVTKLDLSLADLRYLQINLPSKQIVEILLDEVQELGIERSSLYTNMNKLGYCGPPMAFICIDRIMREEPLKNDDMILSFVTEVSKFMQAGFALCAQNFPQRQVA